MKNPNLSSLPLTTGLFPSWYVYYKVDNASVKDAQNYVRPLLVAAKVYCQQVKLLRRPSAPADPVTFLEVYQNISDETALSDLLEQMLLRSPLVPLLLSPRHKEVFWDLALPES